MNIAAEIKAIHDMIGDLKVSIALLKQGKDNDKEVIIELKSDMEKLTIAINRFSLIIENQKGKSAGKKEGLSYTVKLFGALVIAWILWVSASISLSSADYKAIRQELKDHKDSKHGG